MPIEFTHTNKEIIKIQKTILRKSVISKEELELLTEINNYMNRVN